MDISFKLGPSLSDVTMPILSTNVYLLSESFTADGGNTFLSSSPATGFSSSQDGFSLIRVFLFIVQQHVSTPWDDWSMKLAVFC